MVQKIGLLSVTFHDMSAHASLVQDEEEICEEYNESRVSHVYDCDMGTLHSVLENLCLLLIYIFVFVVTRNVALRSLCSKHLVFLLSFFLNLLERLQAKSFNCVMFSRQKKYK